MYAHLDFPPLASIHTIVVPVNEGNHTLGHVDLTEMGIRFVALYWSLLLEPCIETCISILTQVYFVTLVLCLLSSSKYSVFYLLVINNALVLYYSRYCSTRIIFIL